MSTKSVLKFRKSEQQKPYEKKLLAARDIRRKLGLSTLKRVRIMVEVFEDDDFRHDYGLADDHAAAELLDGEVADLGFAFLDLLSMFRFNSKTEAWESNDLVQLYELCRKAPADEAKQPVTRKVITRAEYQALLDKYKEIDLSNERLQQRLDEALREIATLKSENMHLRQALQPVAA